MIVGLLHSQTMMKIEAFYENYSFDGQCPKQQEKVNFQLQTSNACFNKCLQHSSNLTYVTSNSKICIYATKYIFVHHISRMHVCRIGQTNEIQKVSFFPIMALPYGVLNNNGPCVMLQWFNPSIYAFSFGPRFYRH